MIKDERIKKIVPRYYLADSNETEVFDMARLRDLAEMAKHDVERDLHIPVDGKVVSVPDGTYSDFECNVWELFAEAVAYGVKIGTTVMYNKFHTFVNNVCPSPKK